MLLLYFHTVGVMGSSPIRHRKMSLAQSVRARIAGAISVNKYGSISSVGLERLIVIQEVIGSIPIYYPKMAAAVERRDRAGFLY